MYNAILKPTIGEDVIIGKKYRSPIPGREDSTPSFSLKKIKDRLVWKDFGFPDASGNKLVNLVMDIHDPPLTYGEAMEILENGDYPVVSPKSRRTYDYVIKYGAMDLGEINWWDSYNVSPRTTKRFKTFGARKMWCGNKVIYDYEKDPMAFVYLGETKDHWQFYGPKPQHKKKWFHRNGLWIWGWEQLPLVGDTVRFMSGAKDGMCAYEAAGTNPLVGNGETDYTTFRKVLPELKLRFRKQDILMDPDGPGRKSEIRLSKELGLPICPFPYPNDKDDIAALSQKFGLNYLRQGLTYK